MAKKIRFPLEMEKGIEVRSLEELRDNFSISRVMGYLEDGKLITWLRDRYANDIADLIEELDLQDEALSRKICDVFDVSYDENIEKEFEKAAERGERIRRLREYTDDKQYEKVIDNVAFDQDELYDLLDEEEREIYLCGDSFEIPLSKREIHYIGVNNPEVVISSKVIVDWDERQIQIENVRWDSKYQSVLNENEKKETMQNNTNSLFELFKQMQFKELIDLFDEDEADDESYYMMYRVYATGNIDVPMNDSRAMAYLLAGYEKQYPICSVAYARYSNLTTDEKMKVYSQCKPQLQVLSDRGNILATHELGISYINETDEAIDYAKALAYFKRNMENCDFWLSAYSIGLRYHNGQGVEQDLNKATDYYFYALQHGHIKAYVYTIDLYSGWIDNSELKYEKARKAFYDAVGINSGKQVIYCYLHDRMWFNKFSPRIFRTEPMWSVSQTFKSKSQAMNEFRNFQYNHTAELNRKFDEEVDSYMEKFCNRLKRETVLIENEMRFCKQNGLLAIWDNTNLDIDPFTNMMKSSPAITPCIDQYEIFDNQFNGLLGGHEVTINNYPENYYIQLNTREEYVNSQMPELYNKHVISFLWDIIDRNWDDSVC